MNGKQYSDEKMLKLLSLHINYGGDRSYGDIIDFYNLDETPRALGKKLKRFRERRNITAKNIDNYLDQLRNGEFEEPEKSPLRGVKKDESVLDSEILSNEDESVVVDDSEQPKSTFYSNREVREIEGGYNSPLDNDIKGVPMHISNGYTPEQNIFFDIYAFDMSLDEVSKKWGVSRDKVREAVRNENSLRNKAVAQRIVAEMREFVSQFQEDYEAIIKESKDRFIARKRELARNKSEVVIAFPTDIHHPYARYDALILMYQILEELNADWVISGSDFYDFHLYGRWLESDPLSPAARLWTNNIEYAFRLADMHHEQIRAASPNACDDGILWLPSNHGKRLYSFLTKHQDGFSDKNILEFVQRITSKGVLMPYMHYSKEGHFKMTPGLKVVHGVSSGMPNTVGRKTIEKMAGTINDGDLGISYHTMGGHVHRGFHYTSKSTGLTHVNAPALCHLDPSYMKTYSGHQLGMAYSFADPNGRDVESYFVVFRPDGNKLRAVMPHDRSIVFEVELQAEQSYRVG